MIEFYPSGVGPAGTSSSAVSLTDRVALYRTMLRIRLFEEESARRLESGQIVCPTHLCIGQEAVAAGVCATLRADDWIFGGHRSHGHYLAKGGSIDALAAEMLGRATGCSRGRGGSMHLFAPEVGIVGTVPIVSAAIPLAAGAAYSAQRQGLDRVAVAFFGDGATEEGQFHEAMNLAALLRLPVVFVCENNWHSSHLRLEDRRPDNNLHDLAVAHRMPAPIVDGNDVLAMHAVALEAVQRARNGGGPTFIEAQTYRWRGHVGPSWDLDVGIRPPAELDAWVAHDPLLVGFADIDAAVLDGVRDEVTAEVARAWSAAEAAPYPDASELLLHVFAAGA